MIRFWDADTVAYKVSTFFFSDLTRHMNTKTGFQKVDGFSSGSWGFSHERYESAPYQLNILERAVNHIPT